MKYNKIIILSILLLVLISSLFFSQSNNIEMFQDNNVIDYTQIENKENEKEKNQKKENEKEKSEKNKGNFFGFFGNMEKDIEKSVHNLDSEFLKNANKGIHNIEGDIGKGIHNIKGNISKGIHNIEGDIGKGIHNIEGDIGKGIKNAKKNILIGAEDFEKNLINSVKGEFEKESLKGKVIDYSNLKDYYNIDSLGIWYKFGNCCVTNITYYGEYIYGVGLDKLVYRMLKTGGNWSKFIKTGKIKYIKVYQNYIYGIGTDEKVYRHNVNGSGKWENLNSKNQWYWQTRDFDFANNLIYGIGDDHMIYTKSLNKNNNDWEDWVDYSPGYVRSISIYKNKIYAIGTDYKIYTYPLFPPLQPVYPQCKLHKNQVWTFCNDKPDKEWDDIKPKSVKQKPKTWNLWGGIGNFFGGLGSDLVTGAEDVGKAALVVGEGAAEVATQMYAPGLSKMVDSGIQDLNKATGMSGINNIEADIGNIANQAITNKPLTADGIANILNKKGISADTKNLLINLNQQRVEQAQKNRLSDIQAGLPDPGIQYDPPPPKDIYRPPKGTSKVLINHIDLCNKTSKTGKLGSCPVIHNEKWQNKPIQGSVKQIFVKDDKIYGLGFDKQIYYMDINGGKWNNLIKLGDTIFFIIIDNDICAIFEDKSIYKHPIKFNNIESFANF